jgi:hypothetical protein
MQICNLRIKELMPHLKQQDPNDYQSILWRLERQSYAAAFEQKFLFYWLISGLVALGGYLFSETDLENASAYGGGVLILGIAGFIFPFLLWQVNRRKFIQSQLHQLQRRPISQSGQPNLLQEYNKAERARVSFGFSQVAVMILMVIIGVILAFVRK